MIAANADEDAAYGAPTAPPRRPPLQRWIARGVFVSVVMVGFYVIESHPPQYASTGTVVIVGSETIAQRQARGDGSVNPGSQSVLARFNSPTVVGDIFARIYSGWTKRMELERDGVNGRLVVTTRSTVTSLTPDHGPVIDFTVFSADPLRSRDSVNMVIADFQRELATWQRSADPTLSVSYSTVSPPGVGSLASGSRSRATIGLVAFAALLSWLVGQITGWAITRRGLRTR